MPNFSHMIFHTVSLSSNDYSTALTTFAGNRTALYILGVRLRDDMGMSSHLNFSFSFTLINRLTANDAISGGYHDPILANA